MLLCKFLKVFQESASTDGITGSVSSILCSAASYNNREKQEDVRDVC